MIKLHPRAARSLQRIMAEKGWRGPLRVVIESNGCCDAALGLRLERPANDDLSCRAEGLEFAISPQLHQLAGEVNITLAADGDGEEFTITSAKPLGEWDGFGACRVRG